MVSLGVYITSFNVRLTLLPVEADGGAFGSARKKRYAQAIPTVHLALTGVAVELTTSAVSGTVADVGISHVSLSYAPPGVDAPPRPILAIGQPEGSAQGYLLGSLFSSVSKIQTSER